jgi:apolipoprotein N-acyltransferase
VEARDGRRLRHNSALLVGADGVIRAAYHKTLPVPFAEQIPRFLRRPALVARLPHVQEFEAGRDVPALALGPWRISTPICSESAEPALVRRMLREARPHLLVTLANDAWFGDSRLAWIHLQVSRLRAVEHRRALVHATQSGVSAVVDPMGRISVRSGLLTRESLRGEVRLLDAPTPYTRLGDWPGPVAALLLVAALVRGSKRKSTMPAGTGS